MSLREVRWLTAGLLVAGACGGSPDAPRIEDSGFTAAAGRLCAAQLPPLRADIADDTPREPAEVAPLVEDRAKKLTALVGELKELDVEPAAQEAVEAWLADWRVYVEVGGRYADALREGDPREYSAVAGEGVGPQERISAFARTNGFEDCALDGVPLPERESPI